MTDEQADLFHVVLQELLNRYVELPRNTMDALTRDIVRAVVKHLDETDALAVPPESIE